MPSHRQGGADPAPILSTLPCRPTAAPDVDRPRVGTYRAALTEALADDGFELLESFAGP